jgi:hypothetical protein
MTRAEFAQGSATFLLVILAGILSTIYVDRRFAATETDNEAIQNTPSTACVGDDGAWKNWPWPNVPMLSPQCGQKR